MKLTYHRAESENDRRLHPQGYYWDACTDDEGWDGAGDDPLAAVCDLAARLEAELDRIQRKGALTSGRIEGAS